MTLDGTKLTGAKYALSNNCGNVTIKDSVISAAEDGVAFDVYGGFGSYSDVTVTVTGSSAINGKIEVDRQKSSNANKNALKIESGTINGELKVTKDANTEVVVSGGSFTVAPADYIDTTKTIVKNTDGTFSVQDITAAAKIGNKEFNTLEDAIAAAQHGDEVTLLRDLFTAKQIEVPNGKTITLNMDGKTIKYVGADELLSGVLMVHNGADLTVIGNGTVDSGDKAMVAIALTMKGDDATKAAKLTVENGTLLGRDYGISGNGTRQNTEIVINGGLIKSEKGCAIYQPQNGLLTINGGDIIGDTGVYIKSGKVVVNGGTITGIGEKSGYDYTGNGINSTGNALVVDTCSYPGGNPTVEIKGGIFESVNNDAVGSYAQGKDNTALIGFISGGTFSSDPAALAAEGFEAKADKEGNYTVKKIGTEEPVEDPSKPSEDPSDKPTEDPADKPIGKPEDKPADKPADGKGAPKTYDAGIAIYGVSAILSVTGMAWVGLKKRK